MFRSSGCRAISYDKSLFLLFFLFLLVMTVSLLFQFRLLCYNNVSNCFWLAHFISISGCFIELRTNVIRNKSVIPIMVPLSLCMESTSYVLYFRMVFFYRVTTDWIFDISLFCENLINQSKLEYDHRAHA